MKHLLILILLAVALAPVRAHADAVSVHALMIEASNASGSPDRRLEQVESKLRRVFQFTHYRYVGEGRTQAPESGNATIALPGGHRLEVTTLGRRGGRLLADIRWMRSRDTLLTMRVNLSDRAPIVLGGVPEGSGTLIVVLSAE
ncbi:MAG TPA: hypothetical protein PKE55_03985 [Kiritimatiellia bacterium]|mgnify:CR=1 FL=1|nr:hypothetical protein [Kiritimatiellia bacterium]